MDYQTKPTSRKQLRIYSKYLRWLFDVSETSGPFPVLEALEKIPDVFAGSGYQIVENNQLPPQTMARCYRNNKGGFTIEIKQSVYDGAYNGTGACLGFICHEISHLFLFSIGNTPIFERSFADNELPAYKSVEWQAKALCAEVMIPYEESKGMSFDEIIRRYHVSQAFACKRCNLS